MAYRMRRLRVALMGLTCLLWLTGCGPDPDVNDDGVVDILDVSRVSGCFGEDPAENLQCRSSDLDADGNVDRDDFDRVVAAFGETGFPVADTTPPELTITSPENLSLVNADRVAVEGSVDETAVEVAVNGAAVAVEGGRFSAEVPLREGENLVTASAVDAGGNAATASIRITVDTQPPAVNIGAPLDGSVTSSASISISGMINDIVVGTVNEREATVTVNGAPARVANRSFLAPDVALVPGLNTITAVGTDRAGNVATDEIQVTFEPVMGRPQIRIVSGNNQEGAVGELLPEPAVVEVLDAAEVPIAGKPVVFRVKENDGSVQSGTESGRAVVAVTDASGRAQVAWTLGTRAGAGNNVVEASAAGMDGTALFSAISRAGAPSRIVVDTGNLQVGVAGRPLPAPFTVVVTDAGSNRLSDVPVTFSVVRGGGSFDGRLSTTVETDSDGRALAVLTLGPQEGFDNNAVEARFPENPGLPATFLATGRVAGDPDDTSVSGVVLDNADLPVPGATVSIPGTALRTTTDAGGRFSLAPAPVGKIGLAVDGSTTSREGTWPALHFELVTVAGRDNTLGRPVYLLPLSDENIAFVDETHGDTIEIPEIPGFSLAIAPGSVTFPDGSRSGIVSVTLVHADKVPLAPSFGQQPRFVISIQPTGARFDPPARITLPNTEGLAPGVITEIYSFDHDLSQFVAIGTGGVSEDGTVVVSDPGVGILEAGWHAQGNPGDAGSTCNCEACQKCEGGKCVADPAQEARSCADTEQNFTSNGVTISVGDGCRGMCKMGICEDGGSQSRRGINKVKQATVDALGKIFDGCMSDPVKMRMQNNLKNGGFMIRCVDSGDSNGNGTNDCASAMVGGNSMTISNLGTDACMSFAKTIRHEMQHGAGNQNHTVDPAVDPVYGCDLACFGKANKQGTRSDACM